MIAVHYSTCYCLSLACFFVLFVFFLGKEYIKHIKIGYIVAMCSVCMCHSLVPAHAAMIYVYIYIYMCVCVCVCVCVRGLEVQLHPFLTMTVDRCEWSASQPGHVTPRVEHVSLHFCLPSQIILEFGGIILAYLGLENGSRKLL